MLPITNVKLLSVLFKMLSFVTRLHFSFAVLFVNMITAHIWMSFQKAVNSTMTMAFGGDLNHHLDPGIFHRCETRPNSTFLPVIQITDRKFGIWFAKLLM